MINLIALQLNDRFFLNDNILTIEQDVMLISFSKSISGSTKFIPNRWYKFLSVKCFLQMSQKYFERIKEYDELQESFSAEVF